MMFIGYGKILLHILLLFSLTPSSTRGSKLYLDEVIEDVVEQLFGRAVQEEFEEFTRDCPGALAELEKAGPCVSSRNLTYARISHSPFDPSNAKQLCDDLEEAGKCVQSVINKLKNCADKTETQKRTLETVGAGLDTGLQFLCHDRGNKLNQLFKEGFPHCFSRHRGRELMRCFPGRSGQLDGKPNYWGDLENEYFFNPRNCMLLRNHTQCAVNQVRQCRPAASPDIQSAFQGVVDTVMDELGCTKTGPQKSQSNSAVGIVLPAASSLLSITLVIVSIRSSYFVGFLPF